MRSLYASWSPQTEGVEIHFPTELCTILVNVLVNVRVFP